MAPQHSAGRDFLRACCQPAGRPERCLSPMAPDLEYRRERLRIQYPAPTDIAPPRPIPFWGRNAASGTNEMGYEGSGAMRKSWVKIAVFPRAENSLEAR